LSKLQNLVSLKDWNNVIKEASDIINNLRNSPNQSRDEILKAIYDLIDVGIKLNSDKNFEMTIELCSDLIPFCQYIGDRSGEGSGYGILGIAYFSIEDYKKAIEVHSKYLNIAIEIGDRRGEKIACDHLGNAYYIVGNFKKAIEFFLKCLNIAIEFGDRSGEGKAYANLGNAYYSLGDYKKAIEYHSKDLNIAIEIGDRSGEGRAYGNLGDAKKAIEYFSKRLNIAIEIGDKLGEEIMYHNLGNCFFVLDNLTEAANYFEQAFKNCSSTRGLLGNSYSPKSFLLETQKDTYKIFELVLAKMGNFERSLEVSEEGRTRSFVDQIYSSLSPSMATAPSLKWNEIKEFCSANITVVEYSIQFERKLHDRDENCSALIHIWVIGQDGIIKFKSIDLDEKIWRKESMIISKTY
jgi:tetratricopeptide (TPR) repeat protein